jgi:hypothetical protein
MVDLTMIETPFISHHRNYLFFLQVHTLLLAPINLKIPELNLCLRMLVKPMENCKVRWLTVHLLQYLYCNYALLI